MVNYELVKDAVQLLADFDSENSENLKYEDNLNGFKRWLYDKTFGNSLEVEEPDWEGKTNGRSAESVISTLLVHMNKYAKTYSKSAIQNSPFTTQEEFIYLITLKSFGSMSKIDLIRKNIQDKPGGIKIIDRLINMGWVNQEDSAKDKRIKIISLSVLGVEVLESQMSKIREASRIVSGNLTYNEKMELIRLLLKLEHFHHPIYSENISSDKLLDEVTSKYME